MCRKLTAPILLQQKGLNKRFAQQLLWGKNSLLAEKHVTVHCGENVGMAAYVCMHVITVVSFIS